MRFSAPLTVGPWDRVSLLLRHREPAYSRADMPTLGRHPITGIDQWSKWFKNLLAGPK